MENLYPQKTVILRPLRALSGLIIDIQYFTIETFHLCFALAAEADIIIHCVTYLVDYTYIPTLKFYIYICISKSILLLTELVEA